MAITRTELENLIQERGRLAGQVLSIYLDVDQSNAAHLRRGYMARLKDMLRSIESKLEDEQRNEFSADAARALEFMSGYDPRARGLVIFCDSRDGFFWSRELQVPVRSIARWGEKAYVRPLVEIVDEYERYAVVLASREDARLFTVYMGEIEENREVFSPDRRKHFKQTAKDNRMSQPNLQRKDDQHAHLHLKQVAETLDLLADRYEFDRLVLAGPHEVTKDLESAFSKRLQAALVRSLGLPIEASEQQVLEVTLKVQEEVEREEESRIVEDLITAGSKDSQAVLQLQPTLEAMRLGRIHRLVYADGFSAPGSQCTNCLLLFTGEVKSCAYCGSEARPVEDVVDRLVELVLDSGAHTEHLRGAAAERLKQAGTIGAFLRF